MNTPLHIHRDVFPVRAYESGVNNRVTLPAYCNYFQELAGEHANRLGVGIHTLQQGQHTWMLARLRLRIHRYAAWQEHVHVTTWPAALRGRLIALRDVQMFDQDHDPLVEGVSEWMIVDLRTRRLTRLPPDLAELAPEGTPRVNLPDEGEAFPDFTAANSETTILVRNSDHDFNNHVNNVHYVEWGLEAVDPAWCGERAIDFMDIAFKAEARAGETIHCEIQILDDHHLLHRMQRVADRETVALMRTTWR